MDNGDCMAVGPGATCKRTSLAGNVTYAAGMCTIENCSANNMCPMGSACLNFPRIFGDETAACFVVGCGAMAPCRSGYGCFNIGNNNTACLPADFGSDELTLDTTSVVGESCELNSQCRAPTPGAPGAGGFCLPEVNRRADGGIILQRDGGPTYTGYPGGFCSRTCRSDDDCTSDGVERLGEALCLPVSQTAAACQKGCSGPLQGQSDCRNGYICEVLSTADGGRLPTGVCDGRCDVPGSSCGNYADGGRRLCFPNGYCDFGDGRQDAGTTSGTGGGSAGGGSAGGGSAGGATAGGSAGGSTAGGSAGGATAGGTAGGSTAGGAAGGATAGGSAGGA
ncbi:MAG: hypothetical protein INH41_15595, partial [Myxococcaceae bacterium]|nr:hypothetical protein [Myxococcaceae bacterium]